MLHLKSLVFWWTIFKWHWRLERCPNFSAQMLHSKSLIFWWTVYIWCCDRFCCSWEPATTNPYFFWELWERNVSKNIWSCESDPRKLKKDNVLKIDVILQVFKALANKRRRRRSREMLQSSHHISQKMSTSRYIPNILATPNLAPKVNHAFNSLFLAKDFFVILRILFKTS